MVPARALQAEKENLYPEYVFFWWQEILDLSTREEGQCNQPATRWLDGAPWGILPYQGFINVI